MSLFPADFIEVKNFGTESINLQNFSLLATIYTPNSSVPDYNQADSLPLPDIDLEPNESYQIEISSDFLQEISDQEFREGVVSLFYSDDVNCQ